MHLLAVKLGQQVLMQQLARLAELEPVRLEQAVESPAQLQQAQVVELQEQVLKRPLHPQRQ